MNRDKTKTMRNNCQTADPIRIGEQYIEEVSYFTLLDAKVRTDGNTEAEDKDQQGKGSICGSEEHLEDENDQQESKDTHFKSNVLSALLYAAESWKVTKLICHMLEVFQNKCLRRILHIFWPNKISNAERTGMLPISL